MGRRVFAPSLLMTALTCLLLVLFVILGRWQWHRAETKQVLWGQFERSSTGAPRPLGAQSADELPRFSRVAVSGQWLSETQFLLDNRPRDGRPGYEVLTPLRRADGRVLLVNRGWVAFTGYRDRLPDLRSAMAGQSSAIVTGRLDELPTAGLTAGRAAPPLRGPWPRVTSYPRSAELAASLGERRVERRVLLLDPPGRAGAQTGPQDGYARDWKPPGRPPAQNWSYAVQWWSFGVLLLVLYVALNLRPAKKGNEN